MTELAVNNPFGFFITRKKNSTQIRRKNNFEAIIPLQSKVQKDIDFSYPLDSIYEFTKNQSLSPKQIAESQTKAIREEINALSRKYGISKFEEVKNFLSKNLFLISLLEEIPNKICQYFGDGQKLSMKISHEPDFPQFPELWVSILTELSAKEALPILEKFDEEWWLENMDRADCKLNIILKFV